MVPFWNHGMLKSNAGPCNSQHIVVLQIGFYDVIITARILIKKCTLGRYQKKIALVFLCLLESSIEKHRKYILSSLLNLLAW
jgi:hypothetical protein